ncbi:MULTISPECIES: hypothetical protein [unclassified Microbacterium]|uniref:hypothetical protein n=1 Tax=unclassified Microbacterium TaxID=2609290 RepID=UPI000493A73A|nr:MULTISPECIES: hypothetical protein [unclassified Microbacterium]
MSRRRWWLIAGAVGVVVLVAGGLWIWQATGRPATAEEAAAEYLRALESGDPAAVEATGAVMQRETLDAFSDATALVHGAEVISVSGDDSAPVGGVTATAEITFRLADEKHTAALTLSPVDGRWVVDESGRGTVTARPSVGSFVSIGGQTLPAGEATTLLPATYPVTAAPAELLSGESSVTVLLGDEQSIDLEVSLRSEATVAAQNQLDDHLEACTVPGDTPPEGCGIRIPWGTEFRAVSEFRYRVEKLPTLTLSGNGFAAEGGVLVTTVTGTGQDGAKREATYRTDSWSLRGDVSFTAEGVVLSAW